VNVGTFHTFYRRLVEKYRGVSEFQFACLDPVVTKDAIERQVARSSAYNTIVAPLNTKVSTLGVALAAFENDSIQLCYAPVEQYNLDSYSRPSDDCLVFQIPMVASPTEPLLSAHSSL
jgi:hypothetical protein